MKPKKLLTPNPNELVMDTFKINLKPPFHREHYYSFQPTSPKYLQNRARRMPPLFYEKPSIETTPVKK